jgi:hypothetical protein
VFEKKKFDFVNFDWDKKPKVEKINWLMLPLYLLGWIAFKAMFVVPFLLGLWIAGRNLYGAILGFVFFVLAWYLFYKIVDR